MRTTYPVMVILALAAAGTMLTMGGIDQVTDNPADGLGSTDDFAEEADKSAVNESGSLEGSASTQGDGSIIGLIISGVESIVDIATMVALLPFELMKLGFPGWFAMPVGFAAQIIGGVGVIEFASNREWT